MSTEFEFVMFFLWELRTILYIETFGVAECVPMAEIKITEKVF